jgi:hypothetical protein
MKFESERSQFIGDLVRGEGRRSRLSLRACRILARGKVMDITILRDGGLDLPVGWWESCYCSEASQVMRLPVQAAGTVVEAAELSHIKPVPLSSSDTTHL